MPATLHTRAITLLLALVAVVAVVAPMAPAEAGERPVGTSGCGRTATPGVTTRRVVVDGVEREYLLSIPEGYRPSRRAPLLFDFHGLGSDMQQQSLYTRLNAEGAKRGFVVITPNGQGDLLRHWSLDPVAASNPDVAFVQAMLRATTRTLCIDARRTFSTGISNGGMFSTLLACAQPGRFAAVAPVAGINATSVCEPGTPRVSILAFHGTADHVVPYAGGALLSGSPVAQAFGVPAAQSVEASMAAWAAFDGCRSTPVPTAVAADVDRLQWPRCSGNRAVVLYRIVGGGHTWPGAAAVRADRLGPTTSSIDATELVLDFFDRHPARPLREVASAGVEQRR
jgi:polyhydroxybutyrate depolymerase